MSKIFAQNIVMNNMVKNKYMRNRTKSQMFDLYKSTRGPALFNNERLSITQWLLGRTRKEGWLSAPLHGAIG